MPTYRPLTDIPISLFTNSSTQASGYVLRAFVTGTSTPTPLFSDAIGTEAGTSVELDARGEFTTIKRVWLNTLVDYKLRYETDTGVEVWTVDPVYGGVGLSRLIIPRTDDEIAAGVTPTNYFYPPGNLFRYGGDPDAADNSTALANMLLATPAGGKATLPTGVFDYATGLTRATPITLIGEGIYGLGGTALNYTGTGAAMTFETSQNGLRLQDFRLVGTASATDGIVIQDCQNGMKLDHIAVEGFTNSGSGLGTCLKLDDCWDITAIACQFRQSRNGVVGTVGATYGVTNAVKLIGCDLTDLTNLGVQIGSGVGWVISGCDLSGLGTDAIGIDIAPSLAAGANHQAKMHVVHDNYIEKATGATNVMAIRVGHLATVGASSIANNSITDNYIDCTGDHVYVDYAQDTVIRGNHHGALAGGKYSANITANANRTVVDIRPRTGVNNLGTNTFYSTNDVQTLAEVDGNYTSPGKSAFSAKPAANILNVTGNGTIYTIIFGTEVFDVQGEFNPATGVFTAQKTGKYIISTGVTFNSAAGMTYCQIRLVTSNRTYDLYFGNHNISGAMSASGVALADMDAGDTAYITIEVGGVGADSVDIVQNNTFFTGALVG